MSSKKPYNFKLKTIKLADSKPVILSSVTPTSVILTHTVPTKEPCSCSSNHNAKGNPNDNIIDKGKDNVNENNNDNGNKDTGDNPEFDIKNKVASQTCKGKQITAAANYITGVIKTPTGAVPVISTRLDFSDICGTWKARWGIGRMKYKVSPGLYAVGEPDASSPVLVTANYKMTFDKLRKELAGLNLWITVLDTKGINVWCAAGKGTFGTDELIRRIAAIKLAGVVSHRTIVLPQLGAPGISAHEVFRRSGFKVVFGPVRAEDIRKFIASGMKTTPNMRQVRFSIIDRLVLTPMELTGSLKPSMIVFGVLFLLNITGLWSFGFIDFYAYVGALLAGCVLAPVLLPFIPGRVFAFKGWLTGLLWSVAVNVLNGWPTVPEYNLIRALGYMLVLPAISAFYAMNFTGSSTYTSFSGVLKEMKTAVPAIIASGAAGIILILISHVIA